MRQNVVATPSTSPNICQLHKYLLQNKEKAAFLGRCLTKYLAFENYKIQIVWNADEETSTSHKHMVRHFSDLRACYGATLNSNEHISPGAKLRKLLKFDFCCTPLWEVIFAHDKKLYHIYNQKIHVGYAKSRWLPKYRPLNLSLIGLRSCETMWFKLSKIWGSSIKNQLRQSDRALNTDKKWSKNCHHPVHPNRAIAE